MKDRSPQSAGLRQSSEHVTQVSPICASQTPSPHVFTDGSSDGIELDVGAVDETMLGLGIDVGVVVGFELAEGSELKDGWGLVDGFELGAPESDGLREGPGLKTVGGFEGVADDTGVGRIDIDGFDDGLVAGCSDGVADTDNDGFVDGFTDGFTDKDGFVDAFVDGVFVSSNAIPKIFNSLVPSPSDRDDPRTLLSPAPCTSEIVDSTITRRHARNHA